MKCSCGKELVGASELGASTCVTCGFEELETLRGMREFYEKFREDWKTAKERVERLDKMNEAELLGSMASERGMPATECLYPDGSDLRVCWMKGWQQVETERACAKASSVMAWATDCLDIVKQILVVAGAEEAAGKLDTVIVKLKENS